MDRRSFLTSPARSGKRTAPGGYRTLAGLAPYTGPWTRTEALHLARRALFGVRKADVDALLAVSMSQAVDQLLTVSPAQATPTPPIKAYNETIDTAVPLGQTWVNTNPTDGGANSARRSSLVNWWTGRLINQENNLLEKMTLFWHNHFAVEFDVIGNGIFCYQNNALLRSKALGNFRTLVKDVTLNTGMLRYLNNYLNTATAPDENYARELQELFTIGKGADNASSLFTENDVKEAAKVLTGWGTDNASNSSVFRSSRHDSSNKTFSAFYNNTVITGRSGNDGALELDDLLNMLFTREEIALHICRKLYRFLVYYTIDAATEQEVIEPMAVIFRNSNYEIVPVLAALLKSEHFYDAVNRGCFIKTPADLVAGLCRQFGVVFPVESNYLANYSLWQVLSNQSADLQLALGNPPNVAGWPAYYQAPQFHQLWINSDTLPKRNLFSDTMLNNGISRNGSRIQVDVAAFTATLSNPADPNSLVEEAVIYLLGVPLSGVTQQQLKTDILLDGQADDGYWSAAWNTWVANPGNTTNATIVRNKLKALYQYLLRLPEYQLS